MSEALLSLVMPVYNVGAYLPACLDSLAAQTLAPDEIIAVDDGSTDACPQILADYARRMHNLRIVRQENAGIGLARGKWRAFVDSDDFVAPDMYQRLVAMAAADDLDMALYNAWYHYEGREPERPIYADTVVDGATGFFYCDPRSDQGADFARLLALLLARATPPDPRTATEHLGQFSFTAFVARLQPVVEWVRGACLNTRDAP